MTWTALATLEHKANTCLQIQSLFPAIPPDLGSYRFYRAFLRQWSSRHGMFFTKTQWTEGFWERCHVYEGCCRADLCDIIQLQMVYRNVLGGFPWGDVDSAWSGVNANQSEQSVEGSAEGCKSIIHEEIGDRTRLASNNSPYPHPHHPLPVSSPLLPWTHKPDLYRTIIDQIIDCGPPFILSLLSLPPETVISILRQGLRLLKERDDVRYCCFDDVMALLLRRWDGGQGGGQAEGGVRWQEEPCYFQVCGLGRFFCEGDGGRGGMIGMKNR